MRRLLPFLLLAVAMPAVAPAQEVLDANAVVATVNGQEIKAGEYYHRLQWFRPEAQSALVSQPAGFQVLRKMISEMMIVQLAQSKQLAPSTAQIDARMAELYRENPKLKEQLVTVGQTEADVRADFVNQESQFNMLTAGLTITDLEVEDYYKQNPDQFKIPIRYKLRIIAVGDDVTAKKVDDALKAGRPFPDVASELSMDETSKSQGGEYGDVPATALSDAPRKAIEITPVGSTTSWIQGNTATRVKFLVEAITPGKTVALDADLKPKLRRRMMLEKGTNRNKDSISKDLEAATQSAKVTINIPQFQMLYNELLAKVRQSKGS